jgi:hypothetical protein
LCSFKIEYLAMASFFSAQRMRPIVGPSPLGAPLRVEEPDVDVHLADVLVRELAELEVDQQVALEDDVVEDEVDVDVSRFCRATNAKPLPSSRRNWDSLLRIALSRPLSRSCSLSGRSRKSSTTGDFIRSVGRSTVWPRRARSITPSLSQPGKELGVDLPLKMPDGLPLSLCLDLVERAGANVSTASRVR